MIRLAVSGVHETVCDAIARRLRGALLGQDCNLVGCSDRLETCPTDFDAVAFVGPISSDLAEVDRAVQAGKHVLLATETILSVDAIDTAVDRGSAAGVQVVVVNPDRMLPSRQLIYGELRGTKLGKPGLIRIHRWESTSANRTLDPVKLPVPLVRDLDLVLWLTQQFPNIVYAVQRLDAQSGGNATGTIQVHLGFADGGMALVDYADCLPTGDGYQSLSAICSNGAMYADDHPNRQLAFRGGCAQAVPMDEGLFPLVTLLQQFVDGLSTANPSQEGISMWRRVRTLAAAVRLALDSGSAVSPEGC